LSPLYQTLLPFADALLRVAVGLALYYLAIEPARGTSPVTLIMITIGVSILIRQAALWGWGESVRALPYFTGDEVTSLSVGGVEVCASTPTGDLEPYSSEYEGYMGNWGNTLDRWYHRAAVVVWPRDQAFANRAETSPAWALDELAAMASAGDVPGARAAAATLAPFWDSALRARTPEEKGRISGLFGKGKGAAGTGELPPRGGAVAAIAARRPAVARAVSITRSLHARPDGRREILR